MHTASLHSYIEGAKVPPQILGCPPISMHLCTDNGYNECNKVLHYSTAFRLQHSDRPSQRLRQSLSCTVWW